MLFVIRQWESDVTGQTLTFNSSKPHHAPAPLPWGESSVRLTWPRPMTPLPFLLYPFFSIPPSSPCAQTSQPFLSSPNAFHSFLHLFHLLPLSLSLPLLFCLPSYFRVRGRCNTGPNLSYLCLSPKQPSGFNTVVCGWTCAPDTRPQGELGDWLRDWSTTGLLHRLQGWLSSGSGVFIGLRKEEMYSLNGWIYCVWNAALRLLVDKLLKQAELCSCNVIEILCFCQFGFGMEVSLMRRFIFFHYKLQLCSKPSHPHIT